MTKKPFYNSEELKINDKVRVIFQPKWTGFNQWVIENIDFVLKELNETSYTPLYPKEVYLMRISEEMNTLYEIILNDNKSPYGMTTKQIIERLNKLADVFSIIYLNGGKEND